MVSASSKEASSNQRHEEIVVASGPIIKSPNTAGEPEIDNYSTQSSDNSPLIDELAKNVDVPQELNSQIRLVQV